MRNQYQNKKILENQETEEMFEQRQHQAFEEFMNNHFYCLECQTEIQATRSVNQ